MSFTHRMNRRTLAGAAALSAITVPAVAQAQTPVASPTAGTRTITDVYGEIAVPTDPQRVVVLDGPMLDACLAVGIVPVGAATAFADAPWPTYLGDDAATIQNIGTIAEPSLEEIINLEPDLILSSRVRHEEIYPTLLEIAPTVFSATVGETWRDDFLLYTNALNREAEAAEIVAAWNARVEEFKAATEADRAGWQISMMRFGTKEGRAYYENSYIGSILAAADLPRPESQINTDPAEFFLSVSPENVKLIDGTHLFCCGFGDINASTAPSFVDNALWDTLDVVKNNRVYWVNDDYWVVGIGYIAANLVVDDLFAYLVDGQEPEQIPL